MGSAVTFEFEPHVLVRTNRFDAQTALLVHRIRAEFAGPITLVCDETRGEVKTGPWPKVVVTERCLADWGWTHIPARWGWFCGDICYYAALEAGLPGSHYLVIENDVFFTNGAFACLLELIRSGRLDVGAMDLNDTHPRRLYSAGLTALGVPANRGCVFPLTFMATRLIETMHDLRRRATTRPDLRLNDEAIFAAVAMHEGNRWSNLAELDATLFSQRNFASNPPQLLEYFLARPAGLEPVFVHPALSHAHLLERILAGGLTYDRRRLRKVLRQCTPEQRQIIEDLMDLGDRLNTGRSDA